jgi:hypothetical protein
MESMKMITGSCLCGKVTYAITEKIGESYHCNCKTCRKAHGAAFSSVASVAGESIKMQVKKLLKTFESSKGKKRYFCSNCGTQIYARREGEKHIILRLGSLDSEPNAIEKSHIWVSQKAPWYTINNSLPEHQKHEQDS